LPEPKRTAAQAEPQPNLTNEETPYKVCIHSHKFPNQNL
jgi:hypothetical protein